MNNNEKHIIEDFTVTHSIPNLTEEEVEIVKKEILVKIYNLFTRGHTSIDTKFKQ